MKRVHLALWVAITLIFVACESNPTQPIYLQDQASESNLLALSKATVYVAELDKDVPSGTVYGPLDDSTKIFTASGGELIPSEYWVDNIKSEVYESHLYANVKVSFDSLTSVTIASPDDLYYLNSSGTWIKLQFGATVSAQAIQTDSTGSGSIALASRIDIEEEDGGID